MKIKSILFLLLIVSLQSCKKEECQSERGFYQAFDEESLDFDMYKDISTIIFLDANGQGYSYTSSFKYEADNRVNNHYSECNGDTILFQYNGEYRARSFIGPDSTSLSFVMVTSFPDEMAPIKNESIVDILRVSIFDSTFVPNTTLDYLTFITSNKDGDIDQSTFNNSMVEFNESIDLLNKSFQEVYTQKNVNSNPIYFNKEFGVVSFTNKNGVELVFDRFM